MPFRNISDLPGAVTDNLPRHGQEIYMAAFNSAWNEYRVQDDRRGDATREETAHKVAWAAVKNMYEKNLKTGKWELKERAKV
jgi:cation transport regulator